MVVILLSFTDLPKFRGSGKQMVPIKLAEWWFLENGWIGWCFRFTFSNTSRDVIDVMSNGHYWWNGLKPLKPLNPFFRGGISPVVGR